MDNRTHIRSRAAGRTLSEMVKKATKPLYEKRSQTERRLFTEWSLIVGAELAKYTVPEKVMYRGEEKVLQLAADTMAALTLQHQEPKIIQQIATYFGYQGITRLKIIQKPQLFSQRFEGLASPFAYNSQEPKEVELPESLKQAIASADHADEEMQLALTRLAEQFHRNCADER